MAFRPHNVKDQRRAYDPDPDQDPERIETAKNTAIAALAPIAYRKLQPGDHKVLGGTLFRNLVPYLQQLNYTLAQDPALVAVAGDGPRRLRRKTLRIIQWLTLRHSLTFFLEQVVDSHIKEQFEALTLASSLVELLLNPALATDQTQLQKRYSLLKPALILREKDRQRVQRARADSLRAQGKVPKHESVRRAKRRKAKSQGWLIGKPVTSVADWQARETMTAQYTQVHAGWLGQTEDDGDDETGE